MRGRLARRCYFGVFVIATFAAAAFAPPAAAEVPVVTVLGDFEDDSIAAHIVDTRNIEPTACSVRRHSVPARGQYCLVIDIGATAPRVSVACDFQLRQPQRFESAEQVAIFYWLKDGQYELGFRIRDAEGRLFETPLQSIRAPNQWSRVTAELKADKLTATDGGGPPRWPIEVAGVRVATTRLGKQQVYIDDLQVEHRVDREALIRSTFIFDEPTQIYTPGASIGASLELENRSRDTALRLSIELAWTRPDGSVLATQRGVMTLPASGRDFRSRQSVNFSQRIEAPGLYQLVAEARAEGWIKPRTLVTSVAVTPSNRMVQRGRSTFFGVQADLLRESTADQQLEIAIANDIGVHLLALEVPWRLVEPVAERYSLERLDPLVDSLSRADIAPLIVLKGPPDWLGQGQARWDALQKLLKEFSRRYGRKVAHIQIGLDVAGQNDWAAIGQALTDLRAKLDAQRVEFHLISPAIPVADADPKAVAAAVTAYRDIQWCFATSGPSGAALAQLEQFRRDAGLRWDESHRWRHTAAPLIGQTHLEDAETVLNHFVQAALAGVGGLIWSDLRDNDNYLANPDGFRGFVRRDFSPKASLLGLTAGAGVLTGLRCYGPMPGAPSEFDAALFIGSERQVAVLLPKPNRIGPAVLAFEQGIAGPLEVQDFERRPVALLTDAAPWFVPAATRPFFVTLQVTGSQVGNVRPDPYLRLVPPWLRAPKVVFAGGATPTELQIVAKEAIARGALRVTIPRDAPLSVDSARQGFSAEEGETVTLPLALRSQQAFFPPTEILLRIWLEGMRAEVPVEVHPLIIAAPHAGGRQPVGAKEVTGASAGSANGASAGAAAAPTVLVLQEPPLRRATAAGRVRVTYDAKTLYLTAEIEDDRLVAAERGPLGAWAGDVLLVGLAAEGAPDAHQFAVAPGAKTPTVLAMNGGTAAPGCQLQTRPATGGVTLETAIPAAALGVAEFVPGGHIRLALAYQDDDADGFPAVRLRWGNGFDGSDSSAGYYWLTLAE